MTPRPSSEEIHTGNGNDAATIIHFESYNPVFGPEAVEAMSLAFEEICAALGTAYAKKREREVIATNIIELARRGERNADRLRDHVLREAALGNPARAEAVRKWREGHQLS